MEKKESMINPTIYIISVKIIVIFNNMDNTDTSIIVVITAFWSCCPASVTKPEEKPAIGGNTVKEGKGWDNITGEKQI